MSLSSGIQIYTSTIGQLIIHVVSSRETDGSLNSPLCQYVEDTSITAKILFDTVSSTIRINMQARMSPDDVAWDQAEETPDN